MPRIFYNVDTDGDGTPDRRVTARALVALVRNGARVTAWRPRRKSRQQLAVQWALSQVGTLEQPRDSNTGPKVREYQAATTVPGTRWAWCQAFARWVWDRAGIQMRGYRGAYVPHAVAHAKKAGKWSRRPVLGAQGCFDWDGDGVADHVAIVVELRPGRAPVFVGGNEQPGPLGDQSNGGGVHKRTDRTPAQLLGYIHP